MEYSFYKELQDLFIKIRYLYSNSNFDQEIYNTTIFSIKDARNEIKTHSIEQEKEILLYCIDTLFEIINEGNAQKIFDYADTIHNFPEIYMQKRNLYSFRDEVKTFQNKYGRNYFTFID